MKQIAFVCLGSICRSPMAEYIFNCLCAREKLSGAYKAISRATSREDIGRGLHKRAQTQLYNHGIPYFYHESTLFTPGDYAESALVIGMDNDNMREILRISGGDKQKKARRLLDYTEEPGEIIDPGYDGRFERAFRQIYEGCACLLEALKREEPCSR